MSTLHPPMRRLRPLLLINVATKSTVTTSINKRLCQNTNDETTIQSTRTGIGRRHLAFAVANCVLNRRFAAVTVGSCGNCWKLRRVASEAHNMTENALSILLLFFPYNSNKPRSQTESCLFSSMVPNLRAQQKMMQS